MTRFLLDTSVLIDDERSGGLLERLPEDADLAIATITLAELGTGVELASARHRPARAAYLEAIRELPSVHYDADVAAVHARLLAQCQRLGRPRGAHDLIIAASAIATDRIVVTRDPDGFVDLPGLQVLAVKDH